jgi:hypothetical protein
MHRPTAGAYGGYFTRETKKPLSSRPSAPQGGGFYFYFEEARGEYRIYIYLSGRGPEAQTILFCFFPLAF